MKVLTNEGRLLIGRTGLPYMKTPAVTCQIGQPFSNLIFCKNGVDSHGDIRYVPLSAGCTLLSYYHCCQTVGRKYGRYVADDFLQWFNHYGGEEYFKTLEYYGENGLFPTLATLTGIECDNTSADYKITEENYAQIKQAIFSELKSGMPVTLAITLHGQTTTGGHSIMAKGVDVGGKLIVCDSNDGLEKSISYEDLLEANGHDGYSIVRICDQN